MSIFFGCRRLIPHLLSTAMNAPRIIFFLVCTLQCGLGGDDIRFLMQPQDVTVFQGRSIFIPCSLENTDSTPSWNIAYKNRPVIAASSTFLPPKHMYNGTGIILKNVDIDLNETEYTCYLILAMEGKRNFSILRSTTGKVTVIGTSSMLKIMIGTLILWTHACSTASSMFYTLQ